MQWFLDREEVADAKALIEACGAVPLTSPARSTVPLVSVLRHDLELLTDAAGKIIDGEIESLHLEYSVKSPHGAGKRSFTDLLVRGGDRNLAIEAKWTEPRYETTRAWLATGKNLANRRDVLAGWLELLNEGLELELTNDDIADLPYQLIHRTASACEPDGEPALAYLVFRSAAPASPAIADYVREDLGNLRMLVPRQRLPIALMEATVEPTKSYARIANLRKGDTETGVRVCKALGGRRLLNVADWSTQLI